MQATEKCCRRKLILWNDWRRRAVVNGTYLVKLYRTDKSSANLETNATSAELAAVFGPRWAICRATPKNVARYGNCITKKQYTAAKAQAIAARTIDSQNLG